MTGLGEAPARGLLGVGVPSSGPPVCGTYRGTTIPTVQRGASLLGLWAPGLVCGVERLWGGVVFRAGLGEKGQYLGPLGLRERKESCSALGGQKHPRRVRQPTAFCRDFGRFREGSCPFPHPPCTFGTWSGREAARGRGVSRSV